MSIVGVSRLIPLSTGYRDCCLLREACLPVRIRRRRWVKTSERRRNSFDGFQSGCGRQRDVIVHCGLPFDWPSTFLVPSFPFPSPPANCPSCLYPCINGRHFQPDSPEREISTLKIFSRTSLYEYSPPVLKEKQTNRTEDLNSILKIHDRTKGGNELRFFESREIGLEKKEMF